MLRRLALVVLLAGCGGAGGGADAPYASVSEEDARIKANQRAKELERRDATPLKLVEFREGKTREGLNAWLGVYADTTGEFDDLCVWVYGAGVEADDCPGYAGVSHATARIESEREAKAREKDLGVELKFVKLDHGKGEGGKPAWEAVYEDTTGEYPDLCVWVQSDPKEPDTNLISSDDCR